MADSKFQISHSVIRKDTVISPARCLSSMPWAFLWLLLEASTLLIREGFRNLYNKQMLARASTKGQPVRYLHQQICNKRWLRSVFNFSMVIGILNMSLGVCAHPPVYPCRGLSAICLYQRLCVYLFMDRWRAVCPIHNMGRCEFSVIRGEYKRTCLCGAVMS